LLKGVYIAVDEWQGGLAIPAKGPWEIITAPFGRGNGGLSVRLMNFPKIAKEVFLGGP
jgi:hypothetical protein